HRRVADIEHARIGMALSERQFGGRRLWVRDRDVVLEESRPEERELDRHEDGEACADGREDRSYLRPHREPWRDRDALRWAHLRGKEVTSRRLRTTHSEAAELRRHGDAIERTAVRRAHRGAAPSILERALKR